MKIRVIPPEGSCWEVEFNGTTMSIGRSPMCGIVLPDRNISRQHATLSMTRTGKLLINDNSSRYGIQINNRKIRDSGEFKEGDMMRIGGYMLNLVTDGATPSMLPTLDRMEGPTKKLKGLADLGKLSGPVPCGQETSGRHRGFAMLLAAALGCLSLIWLLTQYLSF